MKKMFNFRLSGRQSLGFYACALLVSIGFVLLGCGGETGGGGGGGVGSVRTFYAQDSSDESYYQLTAALLAVGQHCKVYVEQDLDDKYFAASSPETMAKSVAN